MTCEKSANGRSAGNNAASRVDPNGRSGRLADLWLRGGMSRRGDTVSQLEADSPRPFGIYGPISAISQIGGSVRHAAL